MKKQKSGSFYDRKSGRKRGNGVDHQINTQKAGGKRQDKPVAIDPSCAADNTAVAGNPLLQHIPQNRSSLEDSGICKLSAASGLGTNQPGDGRLEGALNKGRVNGEVFGCHQ